MALNGINIEVAKDEASAVEIGIGGASKIYSFHFPKHLFLQYKAWKVLLFYDPCLTTFSFNTIAVILL